MLEITYKENIIVIIIGTAVLVLLGGVIVSFLLFYQNRKQKNEAEKKEMQMYFQQEMLHAQLEIQEQTLKNISQEIHDNIGQALTLAKLNLNTMLPVEDPALRDKINNSKSLVGKAISDLRDLSHSLDTDYVKEMGLQRAIEYELEIIAKTGSIKTHMEVEEKRYRFDKQKELILFRIVQETFNNIIKHAGAKTIRVTMRYGPQQMELLVNDDGSGFDLGPLNENREGFGLGIRNMHSRARLINADFQMTSHIGEGTELKITVPVETNNHEAE